MEKGTINAYNLYNRGAQIIEDKIFELEKRIDELESHDFDDLKYDLKSEAESLREEVNEVLSNFESMTEGYTVSVKLNPPS